MSDHPPSEQSLAALDLGRFKADLDRQFSACCSIGIRFDRLAAEARGCLLGISQSPLLSAPEILAVQSETLSSELLRGLVDVERDATDLTTRELLHSELTVIAIRIVERLFADAINSRFIEETDSILAIGIHGDGVWNCETEVRCYHEMVDVSRIAEHFGRTIVSGFPERDVAQGGCGGPVESHGVWLLLADRNEQGVTAGCCWRGLVDVNSYATQFSMIGPIDRHLKSQMTQASDICVGDRLLAEIAAASSHSDGLATECDAGHNSRDEVPTTPSALLRSIDETARNGTPIRELHEIWDAVATRSTTWSPVGISPLPLVYALRNSIYASSPPADLLATASQFIASEVSRHVRYGIPAATPIGELFVVGNAGKCESILDRLPDQIPGVRIRSLADLGQDRTLYAAGVAALALLHLWQVPLPSTKVGEVPRVLGRITPGNPSNWRRVLSLMNSNAPWLLPLREAI